MDKLKINLDLEYLLMRVFLPFLEDQIFHQMENYLSYQRDNGKNLLTMLHNFVDFYLEKILLINQHY